MIYRNIIQSLYILDDGLMRLKDDMQLSGSKLACTDTNGKRAPMKRKMHFSSHHKEISWISVYFNTNPGEYIALVVYIKCFCGFIIQ